MLGLGVLAASKALGNTDWIVQYREAFRLSVTAFEKAAALDANDPRFPMHAPCPCAILGQTEAAADAARTAAALSPGEPVYRDRAAAFDQAANRESQSRDGKAVPGGVTWNDVILPARTKRELRQMQLLAGKSQPVERFRHRAADGSAAVRPAGNRQDDHRTGAGA